MANVRFYARKQWCAIILVAYLACTASVAQGLVGSMGSGQSTPAYGSSQISKAHSEAEKQDTPPRLYNIIIATRSESEDTPYIFVVSYLDAENTPPEYVSLILDNTEHKMSEVDARDKNYSNGKDYQVTLFLKKGVHLYYFRCSDGNHTVSTRARVVVVKGMLDMQHSDLVTMGLIFLPLFFVLLLYMAYVMRKIMKILKER